MKQFLKITIPCLALLLSHVAGAAQAPVSAQEAAPKDYTGYWVALVTEDWRFRMMTAGAGDHEGVPLNAAGEELADAWDPVADTANGMACKAYGAGGIMRIPTRLHIEWASDNVLSIETDAGMQTRLLKFGPAQDMVGAGSLQGVTKASWNLERAGRFGPVVGGFIEAVTTDVAPGYFRRNGVPYSDQTTITEYYELVEQDSGEEYLIVISILNDPVYLTSEVLTSTNFKREPNNRNWNPQPCMAQ